MRSLVFALGLLTIANAEYGNKVVYGTDNRQDVCQASSELFKNIARQSIVALMDATVVDSIRSTGFRFLQDLQTSQQLCDNQRFLTQPAAAFCSGTLVGPDLILTAGHCIPSPSACRSARFVFRYMLDGTGCEIPDFTDDDIYKCSHFNCVQETNSDGNFDHCLVHLDRPVVGKTPVQVQTDPDVPVTVGQSITVIGCGSGIPFKIDSGGHVLINNAGSMDFFDADTDTFSGNSGSGAFDTTGKLVGILVRGNDDYIDAIGGCKVVNRVTCSDAVCSNEGGGESLSYPFRAMNQESCTTDSDCTRAGQICFTTTTPGHCATPSDSAASSLSVMFALLAVVASAWFSKTQ